MVLHHMLNGMYVLFFPTLRLVMSFEAIAENLVAQDDFETLEIVGEDITMKAERVSQQYSMFRNLIGAALHFIFILRFFHMVMWKCLLGFNTIVLWSTKNTVNWCSIPKDNNLFPQYIFTGFYTVNQKHWTKV